MNIYVPFSIFFVTMLFIVIRFFDKFKIDSFQAIIFNYFAAASCSFLVNFEVNVQNLHQFSLFIKAGLPIGLLFISIFYLMALVTRTSGVAIASVLSKMSVVIPIVAGVILYDEKLNPIQIAGIIIALIAVYLTGAKEKKVASPADIRKLLLLIMYFIGSGLVDTSIKFVQANLMNSQTENLYIVAIFGCAGIFGLIKVTADYFDKGIKVEFKNIAGGVILGCTNYLSLFLVVKALQVHGAKSAVTFAIINIGVLLLAALCGYILFRERFSPVNYAGFLLAISAIVMLSF